MEKITAHSIELIITCGLLFSVLKYWGKKIKDAYFLESNQISYSLFISTQIIALVLIVVEGIDPQNSLYMKGMNPFGVKAVEFWSIYGVYILGFALVYVLSFAASTMLIVSINKNAKNIKAVVADDNWPATVVFGVLSIAISFCFSLLVLRPFLYEWVSSNAQFIPLN